MYVGVRFVCFRCGVRLPESSEGTLEGIAVHTLFMAVRADRTMMINSVTVKTRISDLQETR